MLCAARGLRREETAAPAALFRLVRDMPYRRPPDPRPETLIRCWCATCSGKHVLPRALFEEVGVEARLMIATYRYTWSGEGDPPEEIAAVLAGGPVPDVHNYLDVRSDGGWRPVDATWPIAAAALGFPVNCRYVPGVAQAVACTAPFTSWPVPDGADLAEYKEEVLRRHCGAERGRREAFIAGLVRFAASKM